MAISASATPTLALNEWKPFRRADMVVLNQSSALERRLSLSADPLPQ